MNMILDYMGPPKYVAFPTDDLYGKMNIVQVMTHRIISNQLMLPFWIPYTFLVAIKANFCCCSFYYKKTQEDIDQENAQIQDTMTNSVNGGDNRNSNTVSNSNSNDGGSGDGGDDIEMNHVTTLL